MIKTARILQKIMRHAFKFPRHIQEAVRTHVQSAVRNIQLNRFSQEPAYVSALLISLQGVVYDENDGFVEFLVTSINDKGRGSAEKWSGVDCVITASIRDADAEINKAILFQAKKGNIQSLPVAKRRRLESQIRDMKKLTRSPKVLEIPDRDRHQVPTVASGNRILTGGLYKHIELPDYFVQRVLTTFDGDTRPPFVESVQESALSRLKVLAVLKRGF